MTELVCKKSYNHMGRCIWPPSERQFRLPFVSRPKIPYHQRDRRQSLLSRCLQQQAVHLWSEATSQ